MSLSVNLIKIDKFAGINQSSDYTQIALNESPDMLNMELDTKGALNKRKGYKRIMESLGEGSINGQFLYNKKDGTIVELFAHGTKLYKLTGTVPSVIYTGLNNARVRFFVMNDICYIFDSVHYLQFDGTTVSEPVPYIPLVYMSDTANNNRVKIEDYNLLGAGFREKFVGDATNKIFQLSLTNLDATALIVKVDGVLKTVTTDYTVDRVTGKVTFVVAPPKNTIDANNIDITAYKTSAANKACISKCNLTTVYGGSNDTRVLISGNPDYPNRVWRSGIYDATYWPDLAFINVGSDNEKVMNFSKQYDSLVIIKERSLYAMSFASDANGVFFTTKPINDQVGCVASESTQLIENNPVFLSKKGVYMLTQSAIRDERNVKLISENVNRSLLSEPNLDRAVSVDYNGKYMLFVNSKGYIYDYRAGAWYIWDNINPSSFLEKDSLYFGSSSGMIYRFKLEGEPDAFNDDGEPINAYWYSKLMDLGISERYKNINKIFYTMKPNSRTSIDVYKIDNTQEEVLIHSNRMDLFNFKEMFFDYFSFIGINLPQSRSIKAKIKKIAYFQVKVQNNKVGESLGVTSISFEFIPMSYVR